MISGGAVVPQSGVIVRLLADMKLMKLSVFTSAVIIKYGRVAQRGINNAFLVGIGVWEGRGLYFTQARPG